MKKVQRLLSALLVCCMVVGLLPIATFATDVVDSGTCGENLTWTLDSAGTLIISGTGDMENYETTSPAPWKSSHIVTAIIKPGVTSIGLRAFDNCVYLTSVTIPDSVNNIASYAFDTCYRLTSVIIPDGVTRIASGTFSGCSGLTSVTIPDSVTNIDGYAFYCCTSLDKVTIPDSVNSIDSTSFEGCRGLTDIDVDANNPQYSSTNGILFNKSHTNLICYPSGKDETYCIVSDGVTSIGSNAFYGCENMTYIVIPSSVTHIGSSAFIRCINLKDVYYIGSEVDWTTIFIESYNELLTTYATIHYNSTGPDDIGSDGMTSVYFLSNWDVATRTVKFGDSELTFPDKYTVADDVDVSGIDLLLNKYVLITMEQGSNALEYTITDIQPVESKIGTVSATGEHSLTIDGTTYPVREDYVLTSYDGQKVLYHICNGTIMDFIVLEEKHGVLGNWNDTTKRLTIGETEYPTNDLSDLSFMDNIRDYFQKDVSFLVADSSGYCPFLGIVGLYSSGEDTMEPFDVDIYRAKWLSSDTVTADTFNGKTSSQILSEQVSSVMEPTATLWKSFTACFDALDDISSVADLAVEKKDMYTAIILTALESSYSLDVISSEYKDYMSLCSSFVGSVNNTMKEMYTIDIMQSGNLQKLTTDQQKTLEDVSGEWFKENFSTQYNVGQVFSGFQNAIKIMGNIEDFYEYAISMIMLTTMRDDLKAVVRKAAELSKTSGNRDLVLAFADCADTIDRSTVRLFEKIYTHELTVVGKETAGYLIGELWNEVTSELYTSCPEAYILMMVYKVERYITDKVFSTDKIVEKYLKMIATLDVEELMTRTYIELGAEFLYSMNKDTAKAYLSGMDIMYNLRDGDCTAAYNYVDEIDGALFDKVLQAFGKKSYDELKEAINGNKSAYKANHYSSTWGWIVNLDVDYPDSGLYEHYYALSLEAALHPDREIKISCPVDVYVYDKNDNLVAYVIGDVVSGHDNLTIAKIGDEKVIRFFGGEGYRIEYIGYDAGDMDITITEFNSSKDTIRTVNYYDVALTDGKAYSMNVDDETLKPYNLLDEATNATVSHNYDSMDTNTKHTVKVISGTLQQNGELFIETTASNGETLQLDAYVPDGYEFVRWETTSETVSIADSSVVSTTMIMVDEDITVTAIMKATAPGKSTVSISDVSASSNLAYTGAPQQGYTGTPTSTYTGDYEINYTGRNGTEYNSTTPPSDAGDYMVTIKIPDSDASYAGSIALEFTIEKAMQTAPVTPELSSKTSASVTLKTVAANSNGAAVEYSKDGGTTWQSSSTFTGLSASTEYNFVVRYSETENYTASDVSTALKVQTSNSSSTTTPTTPNVPSYNPGSTYVPPTYSITAPSVTGGTVSVSPASASSGSTVTITTTPDNGYELASLTVTANGGKNLILANTGNGKYTFTMPSGQVSINAVFQPIEMSWSNPFTDVSRDAWYYDAVKFANQNGLMNGIGNGLFAPEANLSRAMLAEILYNKEGRPTIITVGNSFSDVAAGTWYADAVTWAAANGLVNGYGAGLFGPNDNITREQLAVMLWRYAGSPAATDRELHFADAYKVSGWALDALLWATEKGIINGKGNGILDPTGFATRAETAQMLKNYFEK